jgi:hypothetical protein
MIVFCLAKRRRRRITMFPRIELLKPVFNLTSAANA